MAAGISVPYDLNGTETANLVKNQWPRGPTELPVRDFNVTSSAYGVHVPCHAGQSYKEPSKPAGSSKRMGAFYEKTGVMQHRTEPGFRDTKGMSTFVEEMIPDYGTLRRSTRLPGAGSLVLSAGPPGTGRSHRSRGGRSAGGRSISESAGRHSRGGTGGGRLATGSSQASSVPSWARRVAEQEPQRWSFETLPMYERTSDNIGKQHASGFDTGKIRAAGKSDSGFLDPSELIARLTRAY